MKNCMSCGAILPEEPIAFCPTCGTPTAAVYGTSSTPHDPTVASSPYAPPPTDPTVAASPPYGVPPNPGILPQSMPSTAYGSPPYGAPQNPYESPSPYPYSDTPPPTNPYEPQGQPYTIPPIPPGIGQPRKSKRKLGLIIGLIALVVILVCACIITAIVVVSKNPTPTNPTPTPTTTRANSPSGSLIEPSAAAIITDVQMASAIDSNYNPTKPTSTFTGGDKVYATFNLNSGGKAGYAQALWYTNGTLIRKSAILTVKSDFDHGYFATLYSSPTHGAVELYWCTHSDCSDAQLATVTNFTVKARSNNIGSIDQHAIAIRDMDQRSVNVQE